jgi:hypothetical protein
MWLPRIDKFYLILIYSVFVDNVVIVIVGDEFVNKCVEHCTVVVNTIKIIYEVFVDVPTLCRVIRKLSCVSCSSSVSKRFRVLDSSLLFILSYLSLLSSWLSSYCCTLSLLQSYMVVFNVRMTLRRRFIVVIHVVFVVVCICKSCLVFRYQRLSSRIMYVVVFYNDVVCSMFED